MVANRKAGNGRTGNGLPKVSSGLIAFIAFVALLVITPDSSLPRAFALDPENSRVRKLIESGKQFLADKSETRVGGKALVGTVFVKDGDSSHPRVEEALVTTLEFTAKKRSELVNQAALYDICMCTIFLCETDSVAYRPQIEKLLGVLWERQADHGGFGYYGRKTGDTSMTQYVILSAWTAYHHDIAIDWEVMEKVLGWLVRTQTLEGAWGYQAIDTGKLGVRREQSDVRMSLVVGGLGSVYICADLLGAGKRLRKVSPEEAKLPSAFKLVKDENKTAERKKSISPTMLSHVKRATIDGNKYFASHFEIPYGKYDHYYLYGMERYESFRKQIDGRDSAVPSWYEQGVSWLETTRNAEGGWNGDCIGSADTAFALLFLMRSTEKAIKASLGQGLLTGGRGLPSDTSNIRLRRGKIVAQPLTASPDEIFSIMEDPDSPDFAALADNPESVLLSADPGKRSGELQRLRRLVQSGTVDARRLAVQALARHRDFDNVPVLIFALGDKDHVVVREARDALRFISRRFDGFDMPPFPDDKQQSAGVAAWKGWYRSIRPDARFLE